MAIALGQAVELISEDIELAREGHLHNQFFAVVDQLGKIDTGTSEAAVGIGEAFLVLLLDEDPVEGIEKIVASGAIHWPVLRKALVRPQNFLHHNKAWAVMF